ncbi:cobalamin biosynthesis protein CbiX [Streptomyces nigrescens]|uniref:Cobalamin biosynthesis protein CbiX n=2 Tax=Streptomyces TaxID=1883 RepID=A0ABM7ZPM7_STRNI|nr:sirohydrochlorin chelatase [Streptomyces nigrescens]MEE4421041.1 sirohydrochlorin chelatase [Streptomyces sp. DSM 41528]BDM68131.1 cobalamin biosynthesis protein CbiX [Streptomyces nigrescens]
MTTPPALLIAGHGARDDGAAEALRALVRAVGERHPEVPVAGGFFGAPGSPMPLAGAVDGLAGRGVTELVAVPLLLAPTGTGTETLPAALARAAAGHPDLRPVCAAEPGPDPRLLDVLERRLEEALGAGSRTPQDRARTTVLLVGRGASDPHANAEVARAARLLWEGRGFAGVETAFVGQTAPDVPAGLDRCRALAGPVPGAAGPARVVVLPYAFFADGQVERLWMQTEGWAAAHPDIEVFGAQVLGTGPEVAEVVVDRYRAAVAGDRAADDGAPYGPARVAAGAGER